MTSSADQIDIEADLDQLVERHFDGLHSGGGRSTIRGGQTAANAALAALDIRGYASSRSEVLPHSKRGATMLSPYIRHNLLTLKAVWQAVERAPFRDREKFQDELLWQEYARHLYARLGTELFENLRFDQTWHGEGDGWNRGLLCVDTVVDELETSGWLVNQTRMWLASHWTVRNGVGWLAGQERMYRELLDGSRAANLLGWQWTVGSAGKQYGFARWQVEKRAPGLCQRCPLQNKCPIQEFPEDRELPQLDRLELLSHDPNLPATTGPLSPIRNASPEVVLLTIDSLGDGDPALVANPELPVVFVFNRVALSRLQLSSKRIYFYLETLQDLASRRDLSVYLGSPYEYANERPVAVTYAPVPSFNKFAEVAELHPFPWLLPPHARNIQSYTAWRQRLS